MLVKREPETRITARLKSIAAYGERIYDTLVNRDNSPTRICNELREHLRAALDEFERRREPLPEQLTYPETMVYNYLQQAVDAFEKAITSKVLDVERRIKGRPVTICRKAKRGAYLLLMADDLDGVFATMEQEADWFAPEDGVCVLCKSPMQTQHFRTRVALRCVNVTCRGHFAGLRSWGRRAAWARTDYSDRDWSEFRFAFRRAAGRLIREGRWR